MARPPPGAPPLHIMVAASVDAPPELLPYFADLFRGLPSLGSQPRRTAGLPGLSELRPSSRVLDLACGKGAFALHLAARYGCQVTGVDACGAFVEQAAMAARRRGLAKLCTFRVDDVGRGPFGRRFDAASMLGLLPALRAARLLRKHVRPGGVFVVDDAFRDPTRDPHGRWERMPTREAIRAGLDRLGDILLAEWTPGPAAVARLNTRLYSRLAVNAAALSEVKPSLRRPLKRFLANQRAANRVLGGPLRPCVWVVRRGGATR